MHLNTCFDTLRIPGDASLDEAKQSYRQLVKRWHPDQFGGDPEKQRVAHEKLTEINVAYREIVALLKNPLTGPSPRREPGRSAGRDTEPLRTLNKKPSFLRRMASVFTSLKREPNAGRVERSADPGRGGEHGVNAGRSGASDFQKVLKRAIRNQPGRAAAAPTVEGRGSRIGRNRTGRNRGRGAVPRTFSVPRRYRGDRIEKVEKIRPVSRIGKIGE